MIDTLIHFLARYSWVIYYVAFPIWVVLDGARTHKGNQSQQDIEVVPGFKRAFIAWILKIFAVYWLLCFLIISIQTSLYSGNELIASIQESTPLRSSVVFQSKRVNSDIIEIGNPERNSPIEAWIGLGSIEIENQGVFWLTFLYLLLEGVLAITFFVLLIFITNPISRKRPFTIENVKRMRWLGIMVLSFKGVEGGYYLLCNWIVQHFFQFPTNPTDMHVRYIEYPFVIILGLGIFMIAEVIRSGVELKSDLDLTV